MRELSCKIITLKVENLYIKGVRKLHPFCLILRFFSFLFDIHLKLIHTIIDQRVRKEDKAMGKRKRLWTEYYSTIDEAVEYIKRVKDINKNRVQIEMYEEIEFGRGWMVIVWDVR